MHGVLSQQVSMIGVWFACGAESAIIMIAWIAESAIVNDEHGVLSQQDKERGVAHMECRVSRKTSRAQISFFSVG